MDSLDVVPLVTYVPRHFPEKSKIPLYKLMDKSLPRLPQSIVEIIFDYSAMTQVLPVAVPRTQHSCFCDGCFHVVLGRRYLSCGRIIGYLCITCYHSLTSCCCPCLCPFVACFNCCANTKCKMYETKDCVCCGHSCACRYCCIQTECTRIFPETGDSFCESCGVLGCSLWDRGSYLFGYDEVPQQHFMV